MYLYGAPLWLSVLQIHNVPAVKFLLGMIVKEYILELGRLDFQSQLSDLLAH